MSRSCFAPPSVSGLEAVSLARAVSRAVLDLQALGYLGMWHGLASHRIESAIGKTAWYGLVLPWLFIVIPVFGWIALLFWPVLIIHWATSRLNNRFHEALLTAS